jgi:hypothetical protein
LNFGWVTGYPAVSVVFLSLLWKMLGYLATGHNSLLPNPYLLTIHDHLPIYSAVK